MALADTHRSFVQGLKFFGGFSDAEIDVFMGVLRERRLAEGQYLFEQGSPGNACYIIVSGAIQVTLGARGNEKSVALLVPGDLFGQVALIDGGRRSANCVATVRSVLLELGRNEFDLLFNSGSSFAFKFLDLLTHILVRQLRSANGRLAEAASREVAAPEPSSIEDDEIQAFFKDLAKRTSAVSQDDVDLDGVRVVYSEADKARQR